MNLVSTILQFLGPTIINKIAGSLGINQGLAGKAISAAIPAILAGLAGTASKPNGGSLLSNVLGQQDPNVLGNFASKIGGGGQKSLADSGIGALSSLLGGTSTNALAGAVGKFAGIDSNQSNSLMGMLAPVVLGQLAQTQKASGLDAGGLVNLLTSQKDNIAAALPGGFASMLQGTGLLDSVAGNLKAAAQPAAPVAHAAPADSGSGLTKWLFPLVLAVLGAYLLNSYGCQRAAEKVVVPPPKPAVEAPKAAAPAVEAPKVATPAVDAPKAAAPAVEAPKAAAAALAAPDLGSLTAKALGALSTSIGGIKDEATAKAALPALGDVAKQIDTVKTAAGLLSGDARKPISSLVAAALPGLTTSIEKAIGIPGVAAIVNPVLQPMVENLGALAK